jgi:hypothetical protein
MPYEKTKGWVGERAEKKIVPGGGAACFIVISRGFACAGGEMAGLKLVHMQAGVIYRGNGTPCLFYIWKLPA